MSAAPYGTGIQTKVEVLLGESSGHRHCVMVLGQAGSFERLTHFFSAPSGIRDLPAGLLEKEASQPSSARVGQLLYACSMPEPTNRALMEANRPEPGCCI